MAARLDPFLAFSGLCLAAGAVVCLLVREPTPIPPGNPAEVTGTGPRRGQWAVGCGLPLFGAVYGLIVSCLPVHLISGAGFTPEDVRAFFLFTYLGIGAAQLTGGELSDRFGRPGLMVAGLAVLGCGLFCFTAASSWLFLLVVTAMGLGLGIFSIASLAFLSELAPDGRKGAVSGLYYSVWGAGYFLGPMLVGLAGVGPGMTALAVYALLVAGMIAWRFMPAPE
jgi:MFS family permease